MLSELWRAGFAAEALSGAGDPKLAKQLAAALEAGASYVVVLGEDEIDRGDVQVKNLLTREAADVKRGDVITELKARGAKLVKIGEVV